MYAVLPNEVGMSYFPFTAPAANLRLRLTGTYTLHPARGNYLGLSLGYVSPACGTACHLTPAS